MGAASACALVGCGDDYTHSFGDDGFPSGIAPAGGSDPERLWRMLLGGYGMAGSDVDCMIEQIFEPERIAGMGVNVGASAEELDTFAETCDIDTSDLHYTTD